MLPQELTEIILDYLFDDVDSLKTCSIASRCFLEPTRFHLFSSIVLDTNHRLDRFVTLVHNSPGVVKHISYLAVRNPQQQQVSTSIDGEDISKLFTLALQVRAIEFTNVLWNLEIQCHAFSSVTDLVLDWCTFSDFRSFQDFCITFPNLDSLQIIHTAWERHNNPFGDVPNLAVPSSQHVGSQSPRIRQLIVMNSRFGLLGRWLVESGAAKHLHTVQFSVYGGSEFRACARLLEAAGESLRHLRLGALSDNRGWQDLLGQGAGFLHKNTHLETLELSDIYLTAGSMIAARVITILQHLATAALRSLTLHIIVHDIFQLDDLDWTRVAQILNEYKAFGKLRVVVFKLGGSSNPRLIQRFIEGRMSALTSVMCEFESAS